MSKPYKIQLRHPINGVEKYFDAAPTIQKLTPKQAKVDYVFKVLKFMEGGLVLSEFQLTVVEVIHGVGNQPGEVTVTRPSTVR